MYQKAKENKLKHTGIHRIQIPQVLSIIIYKIHVTKKKNIISTPTLVGASLSNIKEHYQEVPEDLAPR